MLRDVRITRLVLVFFSFVFNACSSSSDDDIVPVTVPLEVNEALFIQNGNDCFDGQGNLTASAYVFDDPVLGSDDIDGIAPDPVQTLVISEYDSGLYVVDVVFDDTGTFRASVTCQAGLDNPESDDNIHFMAGTYIRIGRIKDNFVNGPLPVGHIDTTRDCFGCHRVSDVYDIAVVDHDYVLGECMDCHMSAR